MTCEITFLRVIVLLIESSDFLNYRDPRDLWSLTIECIIAKQYYPVTNNFFCLG